MLAIVRSATLMGVRGTPVSVEVHVSGGVPGFTIVGLPDTSCREARDRVRAALLSCKLKWPDQRTTVNLAPSSVRKIGAGLDLAIAIGVLVATDQIPKSAQELAYLGELGLDGSVRPMTGVVPLAAALEPGELVVADANAVEADVVGRHVVRTAANLPEIIACLNGAEPWGRPPSRRDDEPERGPDLSDVRGNVVARFALEVAAAGGHHLLFVGPPGAGKTMLADRMCGILGALDDDTAIEATTIHSAAGEPLPAGGLIRRPPFRAPHHTVSHVALVGGGSRTLRPGEISLAHGGVLFLDEMGEFGAVSLDTLRQPLEAGHVRISRAHASAVIPASFQLVGAMNPCPCGFAGSDATPCRCSPAALSRYVRRMSGPLLDRFDIRLRVEPTDHRLLLDREPGETTAAVAERVAAARLRAIARGLPCNRFLPANRLDEEAPLTPGAKRLLEQLLAAGGLSGRGLRRVRNVALTLDDLPRRDGLHRRGARRPGPRAPGRPALRRDGGCRLMADELTPTAAWLALLSLPGFGARRQWSVWEHGDVVGEWQRIAVGAAPRSFSSTPDQRTAWKARAGDVDPASLVATHAAAGVMLTVHGDGLHPECEPHDPHVPPALLWRGASGPALGRHAPRVAIVGTRRATRYGVDLAREFGRDLSAIGACVVSGLASGIDAAAHAGALGAGGTPLAVVGSGHDRPYPRVNRSLWTEVAAHGAIVSEYPLGTPPAAWQFPARNRILAAISDAVVVIESHDTRRLAHHCGHRRRSRRAGPRRAGRDPQRRVDGLQPPHRRWMPTVSRPRRHHDGHRPRDRSRCDTALVRRRIRPVDRRSVRARCADIARLAAPLVRRSGRRSRRGSSLARSRLGGARARSPAATRRRHRHRRVVRAGRPVMNTSMWRTRPSPFGPAPRAIPTLSAFCFALTALIVYPRLHGMAAGRLWRFDVERERRHPLGVPARSRGVRRVGRGGRSGRPRRRRPQSAPSVPGRSRWAHGRGPARRGGVEPSSWSARPPHDPPKGIGAPPLLRLARRGGCDRGRPHGRPLGSPRRSTPAADSERRSTGRAARGIEHARRRRTSPAARRRRARAALRLRFARARSCAGSISTTSTSVAVRRRCGARVRSSVSYR